MKMLDTNREHPERLLCENIATAEDIPLKDEVNFFVRCSNVKDGKFSFQIYITCFGRNPEAISETFWIEANRLSGAVSLESAVYDLNECLETFIAERIQIIVEPDQHNSHPGEDWVRFQFYWKGSPKLNDIVIPDFILDATPYLHKI